MDAPIAQNKKANRGVGTSEYGNGPRSRRWEIKGFCNGKKPPAHAHDRGGFITVVKRPISPASRFSKMPFVERFFTKENRVTQTVNDIGELIPASKRIDQHVINLDEPEISRIDHTDRVPEELRPESIVPRVPSVVTQRSVRKPSTGFIPCQHG